MSIALFRSGVTARPAPRDAARAEPRSAGASAPARARRRTGPSALAWEDTSLPVVGLLRAAGWLPAILLATCACALVYLVQTSGIATTGYDIQALQARADDWTLRNEQLRLELSKLQSLTWVNEEATNRLHMQRPDSLTYLTPQPASQQPAG